MSSNKSLSIFLKKARKENNLTIKEASLKIGTSYSRLSKIENEKENITLDLMDKLLKGYGYNCSITFFKIK